MKPNLTLLNSIAVNADLCSRFSELVQLSRFECRDFNLTANYEEFSFIYTDHKAGDMLITVSPTVMSATTLRDVLSYKKRLASQRYTGLTKAQYCEFLEKARARALEL